MTWRGIIEEFIDYLPAMRGVRAISLHEGNTPLLAADNLVRHLKLNFKVFLKYEGMNPTGSFKDRGMTVAVSRAAAEGSRAVICASTGNTSASAAAYAARAGMGCVVVLPHAATAVGKLSQALVGGACVVPIKGNFDVALCIVRELAGRYGVALVNSVNPHRLEGQKSAAFEICRQLGGRAPDYLCLPVGNAGNITAYWTGFKEFWAAGEVDSKPRMLGFQARGSDPIVRGRPVKSPRTFATAIRIGNPASWEKAAAARDESGGSIQSVTDTQIRAAYRLLAGLEGVFVEPASAASLAGLIKLHQSNFFQRGCTVVCVLTGHGLKDPDTAIADSGKLRVTEADLKSVARAARLK